MPEAVNSDAKSHGLYQEIPSNHDVEVWIGTESLAVLASISQRASQKAAIECLSGGTWRGVALKVRYEGRNLQIFGPSLPEDLRDIWQKGYQQTLLANLPPAVDTSQMDKDAQKVGDRFNLIRWRLEIIASVLPHGKGTRARGNALRELAGKQYTRPDGKVVTLSYATLAEWAKRYADGGEKALARKARANTGRMTIINRQWDRACPLPEEEKQRIGSEIETYIRSLWAQGVPGANKIENFATSKLVELCRAAGWLDADLQNCAVGRHPVEMHREVGVIAQRERHAKLFADMMTPRIKISRENLRPGDVVVGDVHPLDVAWQAGGRVIHARLISWLDLASYDIFVTVVCLPERRGIRQEDVARSFVDMVSRWGMPKQLRLDNGKEYKWQEMMRGFSYLSYLVRDFQAMCGEYHDEIGPIPFEPRNPISRALPYNASAKQIEGVFGILERFFFSMMDGWIGGDRLNKRTHEVGEAPRPHTGDEERFIQDIGYCLDLYRNTKQKDGTSPNEKLRAAIDQGWKPVMPARDVFIYAFSEEHKQKVHNKGIHVNGQWGMSDVLIPFIGKSITINIAKWDKSYVFFTDKADKVHSIKMGNTTFDHDDPEGAKEQARMAQAQRAYLRGLKQGTVPLNLMEETKRHLTLMPPPPELPEGITITTRESEAISAAKRAAKEPEKVRLLPGQIIHPTTGEVLSIQLDKDKGPKPPDIDFDPLNFTLPSPETWQPKANPDTEEFEFDWQKALIANYDANKKESS